MWVFLPFLVTIPGQLRDHHFLEAANVQNISTGMGSIVFLKTLPDFGRVVTPKLTDKLAQRFFTTRVGCRLSFFGLV